MLSNIDNYHRPLERLLAMARKSVILRESLKHGSEYAYVQRSTTSIRASQLNVHVNHYDIGEILAFIRGHGFSVETVVDRRTGGAPELVIGHPHYWTFVVADRVSAAAAGDDGQRNVETVR